MSRFRHESFAENHSGQYDTIKTQVCLCIMENQKMFWIIIQIIAGKDFFDPLIFSNSEILSIFDYRRHQSGY